MNEFNLEVMSEYVFDASIPWDKRNSSPTNIKVNIHTNVFFHWRFHSLKIFNCWWGSQRAYTELPQHANKFYFIDSFMLKRLTIISLFLSLSAFQILYFPLLFQLFLSVPLTLCLCLSLSLSDNISMYTRYNSLTLPLSPITKNYS